MLICYHFSTSYYVWILLRTFLWSLCRCTSLSEACSSGCCFNGSIWKWPNLVNFWCHIFQNWVVYRSARASYYTIPLYGSILCSLTEHAFYLFAFFFISIPFINKLFGTCISFHLFYFFQTKLKIMKNIQRR
jgi:hypothetical protein